MFLEGVSSSSYFPNRDFSFSLQCISSSFLIDGGRGGKLWRNEQSEILNVSRHGRKCKTAAMYVSLVQLCRYNP